MILDARAAKRGGALPLPFTLMLPVLVAIAALATAHASVGVDSFLELNLFNLAIESGSQSSNPMSTVKITVPEIVFDHQLEIQRAVLCIESGIGATLSGGYQTRLFFLRHWTS